METMILSLKQASKYDDIPASCFIIVIAVLAAAVAVDHRYFPRLCLRR